MFTFTLGAAMDKIDLRPFLRQKVQEWKRATQRNPHLKSIEQIGRELLGVYLSEHQRSDRLASKIMHQLDSMGKRNRMEKYISQMSGEERKYISLVGFLEEFRPTSLEG
jgi:hypothetical protein